MKGIKIMYNSKERNDFMKLLIMLVVLLLSGCSISNDYNQNNQEPTIDYQPILNKEWVFEDMICTRFFTLKDDQSFSHYEACGNPVNNFDCYDYYEIKGNDIIFYGEDVEQIVYEIIRFDETSLLIKTDEGIKQYTYQIEMPELSEYSDYFLGYSAYYSIFEIKGNNLVCGPSFYDGDVKEHREMKFEESLSEDVKWYDLYIETYTNETTSTSTHTFKEISKEEMMMMLEGGMGCAFVWYNDELEINKVVFYGEIEIWE